VTARILQGDVRAVLPTLADCSVQMCVTSPPYWGLRSYLPDGHPDKHLEIGSEATVDEWVGVMVQVFREVRRVLRDDGLLFLNLGDSYSTGTSAGRQASAAVDHGGWANGSRGGRRAEVAGLKTKDLIGQPWMVAFALRADGWWLRQEIIWEKPGPMPESCRDRCTKAHEHIFLLSKRSTYFWNFNAVQEPVSSGAHARGPGNKTHGELTESLALDRDGEHRTKGGLVAYADRQRAKKEASSAHLSLHPEKAPAGWDTSTGQDGHGSFHKAGRASNGMRPGINPKAALATTGDDGKRVRANGATVETRNPRSVWRIPSEPFKGAHYATYPSELARRCIAAGSKEGDVVLDPFLGSGTTTLACDQMGRDCIGVDLDSRNLPMARARLEADSPLFAEVTA